MQPAVAPAAAAVDVGAGNVCCHCKFSSLTANKHSQRQLGDAGGDGDGDGDGAAVGASGGRGDWLQTLPLSA